MSITHTVRRIDMVQWRYVIYHVTLPQHDGIASLFALELRLYDSYDVSSDDTAFCVKMADEKYFDAACHHFGVVIHDKIYSDELPELATAI